MSDDEPVGSWRFQAEAPDWRVIGVTGIAAWFAAPTHAAGAELVRRSVDLPSAKVPVVDVRGSGVQVRIPYRGGWTTSDLALAQGISAAAAELGLPADPSVPQDLEWGIDTLDKPTLGPFWQTLLGYVDTEDDDLLDPHSRDPRVWFYDAAPRPVRDRVHVDVSVPREQAIERAVALVPGADPETVFANGWTLLVDAEGNEADLVPGDAPDDPDADDWRIVFGGMVCYPTTDRARSAELARAVAEIADRSGMPLLIDVRADVVIIDTGKDRWEDDRFPAVARDVQSAARRLGLTADPALARFVQVCIDAVDVAAVREFWRVVLGYENDPRDGVSDIVDPRRLNHPMIFQRMDEHDDARRRQRNRVHLDLWLPHDQVAARRAAALAAGGRLTRDEHGTIADPEGNEVDIGNAIAGPPPDPAA